MTNEQNGAKSRLKPYHIILLSCLLSTMLIKNSNMVNNNRAQKKLNQEKTELFNKIVYGRMLSGTVSNPNTEEVCSRASDDLKEYYKTGDPSKIDLDNEAIECKDKDKSYMKALIDLVKSYVGDDDDGNDDRLRNLGGEIDTDKVKEYGMRVLAMAVFLVIGILSIFGWIVCCFCTCCDCCCCCCCKKISCKVPCFIFTYIFYAFAIAVCVYGLVQTNKIFTGLANTECSFLKFFDQVLDGEMKEDLPKWAGINSIRELLGEISTTISSLDGAHTSDELDRAITDKNTEKNNFNNSMIDASKKFYDYDNNDYYSNYKKDYSGVNIGRYSLNGEYVYDVVYFLGKYDPDEQKFTENMTFYAWNKELSIISDLADGYLDDALKGFKDILGGNVDPIKEALEEGQGALNDIIEPFEDVSGEIGDILNDYSGKIDKYGKMGVNIVFGVLMGMNVALAVLMILIYLFSMRSCASCCCMRCLFKCCTHILWNILALMMILAFIIGSIVALVGRIGGDMMSLVSYIMSEDNFNSQNPLLLDKLGDTATNYISRCIHGDGDIARQLGLSTASFDGIEIINDAENSINTIMANFTSVRDNCFTYNGLVSELNKRKNSETPTSMIPELGVSLERPNVSDQSFLDEINKIAENKNPRRQWKIVGSTDLTCSENLPVGSYYNPDICDPSYWTEQYVEGSDYKKYTDIVKGIHSITSHATSTSPTDDDSIINVFDDLKATYQTFLGKYIDILNIFLGKLRAITDLLRRYSGNGDAFAFLNGKFIGINLKIILKYLKYSLGEDFYIVGICLILVGCGLILSISSTILLLVIINIELKQNMNPPVTPTGPTQGVSPFVPTPVINPPQY